MSPIFDEADEPFEEPDPENEFLGAALEVKRFGGLFRRMSFLGDVLQEVGGLEELIQHKRATVETLTAEESRLQKVVAECSEAEGRLHVARQGLAEVRGSLEAIEALEGG
jgi:hypothetical protein